MQRFAEDELGVEFKFDAMMNPRIDCSQSPLAVRLAPEECVALDLADPKRGDEWKQFADEVRRATRPSRCRTTLSLRRRRHARSRSIRTGG